MVIQTIPYLIEAYSEFIADSGYSSISEDYDNSKAILDGLIIVTKNTDGGKEKYAVLDISGNEVKDVHL